MEFRILKKSKKSRARIGIIKTPHGNLKTPAFFPVATQACVRTLTSEEIKEVGFEGVLCNTYHLMLKPGASIIKKAGGLHKFMNFEGVIATDSGGFQVFSLGKGKEQGIGKIAKIFPDKLKIQKAEKMGGSLVKIREEGVYFKSHLDGRKKFLSPEDSIRIQDELGSDILFNLDECTSPLDDFYYIKTAMERTHRWAERCLDKAKKLKLKSKGKGLFGIVQGGEWKELREESAKFISSLPFEGFGIGGSLGKTKDRMFEILDWTIPLLPEEKPRHLLGIGYLSDIEKAVKKGIDLFDCVYPTRFARHGIAFLSKKKTINFSKKQLLKEKSPIDKNCDCFVCKNYSRAYIAHLFQAKEITALKLLTYHNLWFFKRFMENVCKKIASGKM